jgi:hypothetical protein
MPETVVPGANPLESLRLRRCDAEQHCPVSYGPQGVRRGATPPLAPQVRGIACVATPRRSATSMRLPRYCDRATVRRRLYRRRRSRRIASGRLEKGDFPVAHHAVRAKGWGGTEHGRSGGRQKRSGALSRSISLRFERGECLAAARSRPTPCPDRAVAATTRPGTEMLFELQLVLCWPGAPLAPAERAMAESAGGELEQIP